MTHLTALTLAACLLAAPAYSQNAPVPDQYKRHFVHYVDQRSFAERALNVINLTKNDVGRSFALVAGVSDYPNMRGVDRHLEPAAEDMRKLEAYLKDYEFFDEIVVLKNSDVTTANLEYFLQTYFPERLRKFPNSRFLFAYSGHGMTEGVNGYVLKTTAARLDDRTQAINLSAVRAFMDDVVQHGHHVLVLINACHSGAFLRRSAFGQKPLVPKTSHLPRYPGAHAITSGGTRQLSFADASIGTGSVFFETFFAGLEGRADTTPADGIVTVDELATYLRNEVPFATNQAQTPRVGDMMVQESRGQFFFLNRERMVEHRVVKKWEPAKVRAMGIAEKDAVAKGRDAFNNYDYQAALNYFLPAANANDPEAMAWVAYQYRNGYGVPQNYSVGFEWYERSARAGNAFAMNALGNMYYHGQGVAQDYDMARRWLDKAAAGDDPEAMVQLGYMHEQGQGTGGKKNRALAFEWYQKAAARSNATAMNNLAWYYENGWEVKQSLTKAVELYEKAAQIGGETRAMRNLGFLYMDKGEYAKALPWFESAAARGDADAMNDVGRMYHIGQGTKRNHVQAYVWYEKAALAGNEGAMANLAGLYEAGLGVRQDFARAFEWYEKAARAGNQYAVAGLGALYRDGLGVKKDVAKGLELITKSARADNPYGMTQLGASYEQGLGVERNDVEAFKWYERAAKTEYAWALYRLALMYENGLGVKRDANAALGLYRKSAVGGDTNAEEAVLRMTTKK